MVLAKKCGDAVRPGDTLVTLYATDEGGEVKTVEDESECDRRLRVAAERVVGAFTVCVFCTIMYVCICLAYT